MHNKSVLGGIAAVADEIEPTLINVSVATILRRGKGAVFRLAVASMAAP